MSLITTLYRCIVEAGKPVSLSEVLVLCPDLARRTAQRWLKQLVQEGKVGVVGDNPVDTKTLTILRIISNINTY